MDLRSLRSWSGALPLVMSAAAFALLAAAALFRLQPLPLHDEDWLDHVGMALFFGQLPVMAWFLWSRRRVTAAVILHWTAFGLLFASVWLIERDHRAEIAARVAAGQPLPAGETALRAGLEAIRHSDLSGFDGATARFVRRNDLRLVQDLDHLGAIGAIAFGGIDRLGWDRYRASFLSGDREWRIFVTPDGIVHGLTVLLDGQCLSSEPYQCRQPL